MPTGLTSEDIRSFILESDIQVGILFKKGDMSMDTFLKSYSLDQESVDIKT